MSVNEKEKNVGYCFSCENDTEYEIKEIEETIQVKNKIITVKQYKCICKICGEAVTDEKIQIKNDIIAFDAYKKTMGLLTSEEIKNIRKKYDLSQVNLAKLLGFGEKSIARYESGSIQDEAHDLMLKTIQDEFCFMRIWNINKYKLDQRTVERTDLVLYKNFTNNNSLGDNQDIILMTQVEDKKYSINGLGRALSYV